MQCAVYLHRASPVGLHPTNKVAIDFFLCVLRVFVVNPIKAEHLPFWIDTCSPEDHRREY